MLTIHRSLFVILILLLEAIVKIRDSICPRVAVATAASVQTVEVLTEVVTEVEARTYQESASWTPVTFREIQILSTM